MHRPRLAGLLAITLFAKLWATAACAEEVR